MERTIPQAVSLVLLASLLVVGCGTTTKPVSKSTGSLPPSNAASTENPQSYDLPQGYSISCKLYYTYARKPEVDVTAFHNGQNVGSVRIKTEESPASQGNEFLVSFGSARCPTDGKAWDVSAQTWIISDMETSDRKILRGEVKVTASSLGVGRQVVAYWEFDLGLFDSL